MPLIYTLALLVVAAIVISVAWPHPQYVVMIEQHDDITGKFMYRHGVAVVEVGAYGGDRYGVFLTKRDAKEFAYYRNNVANWGREFTYTVVRKPKDWPQ